MVNSCCAFGCTNRFKKNGGIGFFGFPKHPLRRKLWTMALRRKDFEPTKTSVVCGKHFQTGKPSKDPDHPDYVPNIFIFKPSKKTIECKSIMRPCEVKNENIVNLICIPEMIFHSGILSASSSFKTEDISEKDLELSDLKLEMQQVYSTLHGVTKERDQLVNAISAANLKQRTLQNSISEKELELLKLKKELQQAYTEVNALRREKEELQKKLSAADVTQGILQEPNKLRYYTGLNSLKDFQLVLSLLSSFENNVKRISLETQVLIVLMKLKLNLLIADLAYRFKYSPSTIHRICITIMPFLEEKLCSYVKNPINNALKKNIPVIFKNTVYENLYQRLRRNAKLQTKQLENEDMDSDEQLWPKIF